MSINDTLKDKVEAQGLVWIEPFANDYSPILTTALKTLKLQIEEYDKYCIDPSGYQNYDILSPGFLNTKPDYQRELVWTLEQKRQYVLHYLQGGMEKHQDALVFNLSFIESCPYEPYFEVIDGQQRLNAIISFTNGEFSVRYNDKDVWYDDVAYMPFRILFKRLEFKDKKDIVQYYVDMNKCGTVHSTHDIEKAEKILNFSI